MLEEKMRCLHEESHPAWCENPRQERGEELVLVLAAQHRVSVRVHEPSCAGVGFLEVLKNTPFALLMRHILIRSLKLLASHSLQWLQSLVPRIN